MADQSIDSLSLEIYSSTKKAEDAIDRLVNKLNGLSSALSFGNVSGLGELANGVSRLTGAMTGFKNSGVGKSDFSNIAKSLNQLGKVDVNGVSNAAIAIHTLTSNLSSLGTLAVDTQGIQNIATSISLLGRKTVTQAAQNIPAVNAVLSQLVTTMNNLGAVTFDVSGLDSLTTSISRLGGKAATNAIPNIQNLTAGLVQMMNTLASAPQVSQNLIQMTQAMAQLASAGGRVSSAANAMQTNLSNYNKSAVSASKSSRSLVSQLGLMVAKFYAIVRVAKGMWSSAESAMDYLETLNYFTQAFNQVASKADLSLWEDYGYASAEAYADSFEKRAKELTKKLTGFEIGDNGNLERTAVSSLGLDPDKTTQYQATFAQMASSMGVTSENALKLSNALTMIGADLASVRNLEFTDVWDDLASGMVGMSRTVDKYGVSIREADLQTQLFNLGIEAKVSSLTQADKALLRTITILNSTQYAWADLSKTLSSPSNQIRLLTSNFAALSRTIGSLFLPIITKVLPYINAVTIALQRMFSWLGTLAGIDLSGISSSVGGAAVSMGDFADSEDDATASAKKLKKALSVLSFDALNQLNGDKDESGSSGGGVDTGVLDGLDTALDDALSRYQEVWNAAFESMENRASEMAERIYNALEPIRKIIEDFKVGDFFQAGEDVSNLVVGITDFFTKAIKKVNWKKIGKDVGDFLAGINWTAIFKSIGKLIWTAFNAAIDFYKGMFSEAPFETIILSMMAIPTVLKSSLITSFGKAASYAINFGKALSGNATALATLSTQFPKTSKLVDALRTAFSKFWFGIENGNTLTGLKLGFDSIRNSMTNLQKGVIGTVAVFAEFALVKDGFYDIISGSENLIASIGKIAAAAGIASAALYTAFGSDGLVISAITLAVSAISGINKAFDDIRAEEIGNTIKDALSNPGGTPVDELASNISDALSEAGKSFQELNNMAEFESVNKNIQGVVSEIGEIKRAMDLGVLSVEEGKTRLDTLFGELVELTSQKMDLLTGSLLELYGEGGALAKSAEAVGATQQEVTDAFIRTKYANTEAAQSIYEQMKNVEFGSSEWNNLYLQLIKTSSEMEDFEKAAFIFSDNINTASGNINWDKLILPDGSLDTDYLKSILGDVSTSLDNYEKALGDAEEQTKLYWEEMLTKAVTPEDMELFQKLLDDVPDQFKKMREDADIQVLGFTDMLQTDLIGRTEQVIDENVEKWGEKSAFEKWWSGVFGAGSESEYVKEAVDQQVRNIGELSSAIETSLGDLETKSPGWAKGAMDTLYKSLFDTEYHFNDITGGRTVYSLNEDYKSMIAEATKDLPGFAGDTVAPAGEEVPKKYAKSIQTNAPLSNEAIRKMMAEDAKSMMQGGIDLDNGLINGINTPALLDLLYKSGELMGEKPEQGLRDYTETQSPSLLFKELGGYLVEGLNEGITGKKDTTVNVVNNWAKSIVDSFNPVTEKLKLYGTQMMTALSGGISGNSNLVRTQINNLVNNYIINLISPVTQKLRTIGANAVQSMAQGINGSINNVISAMNNILTRIQGYQSGLQSSGNNLGRLFAYGLSQGMNSSQSYISASMRTLVNLVYSYQGTIQSNGINIGQSLVSGISQGINSSTGYITSALNNLVNTVNGYSGSMYSAGQNLAKALQNGINSISVSGPSVSSSSSSSSKKSSKKILSEDLQPVVSLAGMPEAISTFSGFGKIGISPELQKYASYDLGVGIAAQPISARIENSPYMREISGSPANNFKSSGVDQTILRDAVAQGVALAMMNNSGNQQPISVHATITLPDGRVLTDVVLDEFDRMEDVRPGTIGRRLGLVN